MIALLVLFAPVPLELPAKAKADVLKRIVALEQQMIAGTSAFTAEEAADAIKALGNPVAVQRVLAARYPHARAKEKEAILYVLNRIGVEGAGDALGAVAADFAVARKTHPNGLSFATFYVLDRMKSHAWKLLPEPREKGPDKKLVEGVKPESPPTRATKDGGVTTGTLAERKELVRLIVAEKLQTSPSKRATYTLPDVSDQEWVRVLGRYAFVRLRARSRGANVLFVKDARGKWSLVAVLGHWVS